MKNLFRASLLGFSGRWNVTAVFCICFLLLGSISVQAQTHYYYNGSGNPNVLSSWGTNGNGTGTNPSSFASGGGIYHFRNATNIILTNNLTISTASGGKVVIGDGANATTVYTGVYTLNSIIDILNAGTFHVQCSPAGFTVGTFSTGSTVHYSGGGAQTILNASYYNLASSNTGARTFGTTINVAGSFTPGTNAYTVTGSTFTYNGSASQIIAAAKYNTLAITASGRSNPADITFAPGTVTLENTLNVSGSGIRYWILDGNTIDYTGANPQTNGSFHYNNVTFSGSGNIGNAGFLGVHGMLSLEGTVSASAISPVSYTTGALSALQYNKSGSFTASDNEWPATFIGGGGVVIKSGTITANSAKTIDYSLTIHTGAKLNPGGFNHTCSGLVLGGVSRAAGTWGSTSSAATNKNDSFFSGTGIVTVSNSFTIWTSGAGTTDWATAGNWSNGVPSLTKDAYIQTGVARYPVMSSAASMRSLTIYPGASLNTGSQNITINGDYFNSGGTVTFGSSNITLLGSNNQTFSNFTTTGGIYILKTNGDVALNGSSSAGMLYIDVNYALTVTINNALNLGGGNFSYQSSVSASRRMTLTGTGTLSCAAFNIGSTVTTSGTSIIYTQVTSGISQLTCTGNLTITSSYGTYPNQGTFVHASGTAIIGGSLRTLNANAANTSEYIMDNSSPKLTLTNASPFNLSGTGTSTFAFSGTGAEVNYKGTAQQTVRASTYNILKINNTAGVILAAALPAVQQLVIGDETLNSLFSDNGYTITGSGKTLNLVSGTYKLGSAGTGTSWPGWSPATIATGTTVEYAAGVAQSVPPNIGYHHLTFSGAGTKTISMAGTLSVGGNWSTSGGTAMLSTNNANATVAGNIAGTGAITMSSSTIQIGGNWTNSGTLIPGTGTVTYTKTTGGQTVGAKTYYILTFSNTSGTNTAAGSITVNNTLTTAAGGTLDMGTTGILGGTLTSITNNGIIKTSVPTTTSATPIPTGKTWGGTIVYGATAGAQTIVAGTYNNLTTSSTSGINTAGGNLVVNGTLTTAAGCTLDMNTRILSGTLTTITNNCTIKTVVPTATSATPIPTGKTWGGTIEYAAATGAQTVVAGTYNILVTSNTSGTNTAGGNLVVNGTLTTVAGGTLDMGTTNILSGTMANVTNNGTIKTSVPTATSLTPIPPSKWDGTVIYGATAGAQTVVAGIYNNLTVSNTSGTNGAGGNLTVNGTLTTTSGGTFNLGMRTLSGTLTGIVNNGFLLTLNTSAAPLPAGKTWGGMVGYSRGTGGQTIMDGTYNNLVIGNTSGTQTMNGAVTANGQLILTGGKLALGSNTLTVNSSISGMTATSSLVANGSSSLTIGGSGALGTNLYFDQTTPGTTNRLADLTYNRASQTITMGDSIEVTGTITPTAGTLATGDKLKLISNASGTARVAAGSGSYITGKVTAERYIPCSQRNWRFLGASVSGSTLADLQNETYITGTGGAANGFDATQSNKASVYTYDETIITGTSTTGWTAASNINNPITVGLGMRVFVRGDRSDAGRLDETNATQNIVTLNLVGPLNTGDISMPVSFTSSGTPANDGWNFLANPYASAIDWNALHDAGRTGTNPDFSGTDYAHIDPTVHIFDPVSNSYSSFNAFSGAGIGNLSNGIIPAATGFMIQAVAAAPSITIKESYKTSSAPSSFCKMEEPGQFTIKLSGNGLSYDEAAFKYVREATTGYDAYDIKKMWGADLNISSIGSDTSFLAANYKPLNGESDTIILSTSFAKSGNYKMEFRNPGNLGAGAQYQIGLIDWFTNTITNIKATDIYSFSVDKTKPETFGNERFIIVVSKDFTALSESSIKENEQLSLYPNTTSGPVTLSSNMTRNEPVELYISDMSGKTIALLNGLRWNQNQLQLDLSAYAPGMYLIGIRQKNNTVKTLKCIKE